jgi:pimeloyl-ACP methyl ester carboxylesterase
MSLLLAGVSVVAGAEPPPAPGKLVDIGGRRLHLHCAGTGSPTVIVENGSSGFSIDFALVQPEVAKFTRICTYDRAGYAWSDAGPARGAVAQTVDDLHLLLRKADIRPPYVLVGASIGAIYTRAYQRRYPDEVAGLVLDDPTSDEGLGYRVNGKDKLIYDMSAVEMRDTFKGLLRDGWHRKTPTELEEPYDRLPKDLQAARLWAAQKFVAEDDIYPEYIATQSWRQEFIALRLERLRQEHPLGSLPLIVLGRRQSDWETRRRHLAELKGLSSAGKLIVADNSGHEIHLYRPDLVIEAIREVVTAARDRKTRGDAPIGIMPEHEKHRARETAIQQRQGCLVGDLALVKSASSFLKSSRSRSESRSVSCRNCAASL